MKDGGDFELGRIECAVMDALEIAEEQLKECERMSHKVTEIKKDFSKTDDEWEELSEVEALLIEISTRLDESAGGFAEVLQLIKEI